MKLLHLPIWVILITHIPGVNDCANAYIASDDAYTYCKKSYESKEWEEMKELLRKAIISAEDAISLANDCECYDALSAAEEVLRYAQFGHRSNDWSVSKEYAKKAKDSAEEAMNFAQECDDE